MKTRAYWIDRPFKDAIRFPYGFSRTGVFTLIESEMLESQGCLLQALVDEQVFDPSADDLAFARAIKSGNFQFNEQTRVWAKYAYHQRKLISICGGWRNYRTPKLPLSGQSGHTEKRWFDDSDNFADGDNNLHQVGDWQLPLESARGQLDVG